MHTYEVLRRLDFARPLSVRALFALRGLSWRRLTLDDAVRVGFVLLADEPGVELVLGAIARPWQRRGADVRVAPGEFAAFAEPGYAKLALSFRATPVRGVTHLSTETRVRCTDAESRAAFLRYWRVVGLFSAFIRRRWLALAKRAAQAALA